MYLEPCQTSKMKLFVEIVNGFEPSVIFAKKPILDVWQGSEYTSVLKYVEPGIYSLSTKPLDA